MEQGALASWYIHQAPPSSHGQASQQYMEAFTMLVKHTLLRTTQHPTDKEKVQIIAIRQINTEKRRVRTVVSSVIEASRVYTKNA